jgi:XTP/dITP diphosphohydrolase
MITLLIATGNKGKLREIQTLLEGLPVTLVLPAEMGLNLDVEEDGSSYAENAAKKARAYADASGLISLADDSGLEVDALDGQPGLYSARYLSRPGATDGDRRTYLLQNLNEKPRPWTAHFHCTVAIASPAGGMYYTEGICRGEIIPEERGENGFGYDPIFYLPDLGRTMAELTMQQKNELSHRARAIKAAIPFLRSLSQES